MSLNYVRMKSLIGAAAALVLVGCTVGPNYEDPKLNDIPPKFSTDVATTQQATTQPADASSTIAWWTLFGDPGLDQVIAQARGSNLELREAEARVREARALRGVSSGRYWPDIAGGADYSRSRTSDNVVEGGEFSATDRDLWSAGFDAVWELDVFGGIRRSVEAADRDIESAIADRNDVLLSLLAETARNYVELRVAQRQVAIAEENVNAQKQTLQLTRARLNAGLTSDLDVARSEAQVAATASRIPTLQAQVQQAIHRLSVLTGRPPKGLAEQLGQPRAVPAPPPEIPTGLPSELLRRRPDIRRVERNLAAQTARVGVAVADLYPKFTLTGSLGLQSNEFKSWGDSASLFWSIGPGVRLPIFNAGRLRSQVAAERARTDQLLASYERTVLNSLAEVEDALVAYQKEYARRDALAQAVSANQRAVQLSQQLYQRGLTDFLNVLDAQRALYLAEDELAQSDATVSANAIALFKALGGGWEAEQVAVK
jgi:NodT family efflux transporter outer membrane factor (OMF) lipoprotein